MRWTISAVRRVLRRIGRRGASLLFLTMLSASMAFSVLTLPAQTAATPVYRLIAAILPLAVWGVLWALTTVVSLVQAFTRSDRLAFAFASAMLATWGLIYITTWAQGLNPRGWAGGAIFVAFAGWITIISTWSEVIDLKGLHDREGVAVITADREGTITGWSAAATTLFGWDASQILGHDLTALMPERFRAAHERGLDRVLKTGRSALAGQVVILTGLHRDGGEFPIELMVSMWPSPTGPTFTGVIRTPKGGR